MLLPADTQHTHAQTQHGDSHSFSAIMWCCHGEGGLRHNSAIVLRGRGGPIRETDCSLTVTLPALMPTALPPTETQTHPLAEGPACTGPYRHGNQSRLQCIFHTLHPHSCGYDQDQGHVWSFVRKCEFTSEFSQHLREHKYIHQSYQLLCCAVGQQLTNNLNHWLIAAVIY